MENAHRHMLNNLIWWIWFINYNFFYYLNKNKCTVHHELKLLNLNHSEKKLQCCEKKLGDTLWEKKHFNTVIVVTNTSNRVPVDYFFLQRHNTVYWQYLLVFLMNIF